jgi:uncharacterized membrane protein
MCSVWNVQIYILIQLGRAGFTERVAIKGLPEKVRLFLRLAQPLNPLARIKQLYSTIENKEALHQQIQVNSTGKAFLAGTQIRVYDVIWSLNVMMGDGSDAKDVFLAPRL